MFYKKCALLVLLLVAGLRVFAQRDSISLSTIVTKTDKLSAEHPFEKVYIHFDKPYYAVGDTIWFKAYLSLGPNHQPSDLSRIVYVDLLSSQDSVVKSMRLPSQNGVAFGDITLSPQFYKKGNYHLRAYTNWMRNFGSDYFFNKTITIGDAYDNSLAPKISITKTQKNNDLLVTASVLFVDPEGNISAEKKVSWMVQNDNEVISRGKGVTDKKGFLRINFNGSKFSPNTSPNLTTVVELSSKKSVTNKFALNAVFKAADLQFFPEGGELTNGVRSKIAFKAVNADGIGINITGSVTDNSGAEVVAFAAQHAGMGIFALTPDADKAYKAVVTFPDGTKNTYDLPKVYSEGINLAVNNNDPNNLGIKIATNSEFLKKNRNKGFYIVAQNGGTIYYTALATLHTLVFTGLVPKSKFPTGVLQVTLFSSAGEPLSERVVFIHRNDLLDLSLTGDLPLYGVKQHVKMTVSAKNGALPVQGNFSVAVLDETKVPFDDDAETTILSSLLLTSDLRGYIEKPNYYFNHTDAQKLADLDVLMLTQGYRRFLFNNILADKYPPITYLPEKGIVISGSLRTATGVPVFKGIVNLKLPDKNLFVSNLTDAEGHFSFQNVAFFDSSKVVLTGRSNSKSVSLMLITDPQPYLPVTKNYNDPNAISNIDSTLSTYLQNSKKQLDNSRVLREVVIKSTKPVSHPVYASLTGLRPEADQVISAEKLKNCSFDFMACLISNVFGIWHSDENFYIKHDFDLGNKKPIKFFENGVPIDVNDLSTIKPDEIQSLEVFLKDGISGLMNLYDCNGIISIITKSGTFQPKEDKSKKFLENIQSGLVTLTPKGYYRARMFYTPKYAAQNSTQRGTDLRSTIHWEPNITTDKNGNAAFDFYNADGRGTYKAIIEGIDSDGHIGHYVLRYNVK